MSQTQKLSKNVVGISFEVLESRQLLSGNGVEGVDPVSAHISLDNGVLTITGTNHADEIEIGSDVDGGIYARVTRLNAQFQFVEQWAEHFAAGEVQSIVASGGNGDDALYVSNRSTLIGVPVTLKGGNGNDMLHGESDRDWKDQVIAHFGETATTSIVLEGGNGDDELWNGVGDSTLNGGNGDDALIKQYAWGTTVIIDDTPAPKPPAPVVVNPVNETVEEVHEDATAVTVAEEVKEVEKAVVVVNVPKNVFATVSVAANGMFGSEAHHVWA